MSRFVLQTVLRDADKACHIVRGLHATSCSRGAARFLENLRDDALSARDLDIAAEFAKLECGLDPDHETSCKIGVDHARTLTARRLLDRGILR